MKSLTLVTPVLAAAALSAPLLAQQPTQPKPATEATKAANRAVQEYLNFNDKRDFEDAQRGFIGKPDVMTIKNAKGQALTEFLGMLDTFPFWFNIVTP
jgi:alkyl sulfatase BDS1-like metallo-beta-lactamase superfamily hydrolase